MDFHLPPLKKARPELGLFNGGSEKPSFDNASLDLNTAACSTSGCPYGETCHFSHYVPGGFASLESLPGSRAMSSGVSGPRKGGFAPFGTTPPLSHHEKGSVPSGFKTRLCKRFESDEGCPFGSNCHFAHGVQDLRQNGFSDTKSFDKFALNYGEPTPPGLAVTAATSFGAISTAKVSISSSLAGIIVGKGGANAKAISRATGAKLYIRDHESDGSLKNVEMEGSLDQIKLASGMVRELLANKDIAPTKPGGLGSQSYKSKLCANFAKGSCTYGDRCHFAHGEGELRQSAPL
ncbi:hypothetical protein L7F22_056468 [Adiantum nelumboides]|nr:hypothetical protein [Adiantum nelumboides]